MGKSTKNGGFHGNIVHKWASTGKIIELNGGFSGKPRLTPEGI